MTIPNLQPHLVGELVELRPLLAEDWSELYAVAADPLIWEQHPAHDRHKEDVFREFFQKALDEPSNGGGAFVVIDRAMQRIIGSTRYHGYNEQKSEIEIGWTFLARSHWGGQYNREMKRLMLDHIFQFVERVIFLIGPNNIRSQTAIQRIGAFDTGEIEESTDRLGHPIRHLKYAIDNPNL
jgi:RimJ/RimL family protein N-acetyltransferase